MTWPPRKTIAVAGAALLAVGGGVGGAVAAGGSDPGSQRQAFLNDAAHRLGVQPKALESALQAAAIDRVDAALAAGRISPDRARRLKARIRSGFPLLPLPFVGRPPFTGRPRLTVRPLFVLGLFRSAASYLGVTPLRLLQQLRAGSSLADIAKAQNKSVDGLETAILEAAKARLDKAVGEHRITTAQEQKLLDRFKARLAELVTRKGLPGLAHP